MYRSTLKDTRIQNIPPKSMEFYQFQQVEIEQVVATRATYKVGGPNSNNELKIKLKQKVIYPKLKKILTLAITITNLSFSIF